MNLLAQKIWSKDFFKICCHAGGSTEHLPRPKMKRRDEESSPSDTSTPKKRKPRLDGEIMTYLLTCPLTLTPCFLATISFMYVVDSASKLEKCLFIRWSPNQSEGK